MQQYSHKKNIKAIIKEEELTMKKCRLVYHMSEFYKNSKECLEYYSWRH